MRTAAVSLHALQLTEAYAELRNTWLEKRTGRLIYHKHAWPQLPSLNFFLFDSF
jgi:hypothetical protein